MEAGRVSSVSSNHAAAPRVPYAAARGAAPPAPTAALPPQQQQQVSWLFPTPATTTNGETTTALGRPPQPLQGGVGRGSTYQHTSTTLHNNTTNGTNQATNNKKMQKTRLSWNLSLSEEEEDVDDQAQPPPEASPETWTESNLFWLQELRDRARHHVEEYIRHVIPLERKRAYVQARTVCPHLVATESDAIPFVRYCQYNVWDAAERLVLYWTERLAAFGPDRAFLPLTLTGRGALTQADILSLQAGYPCILPDTTTSNGGQQVVFGDRRQYVQAATTQTRVRSAFYLCHLLAQDDRAQTKGVLLFILLVMPRVQGFDRAFVQKSFSLAVHVFPIVFYVHLLNCLPKTPAKRYAVQDIISSYVLEVMDLGFCATQLTVHIEREPGQLLQELLDLGLTKEGIPTSIGGTWTYDQAAVWCRERARIDEQRPDEPQQQVPAAAQQHNKVVHPQQAAAGMMGTTLPLSTQSTRATAKNPPSTGTLHSSTAPTSRKRVASTSTTTTTTSQPAQPDDNNPQTTTTPSKKPYFWSPVTGATEEERRLQLRTYNAIHSRRKRARRRQEFEHLKEESSQLKTEHALLLSEQARLTKLLQQATTIVQQLQQQQRPKETE